MHWYAIIWSCCVANSDVARICKNLKAYQYILYIIGHNDVARHWCLATSEKRMDVATIHRIKNYYIKYLMLICKLTYIILARHILFSDVARHQWKYMIHFSDVYMNVYHNY